MDKESGNLTVMQISGDYRVTVAVFLIYNVCVICRCLFSAHQTSEEVGSRVCIHFICS